MGGRRHQSGMGRADFVNVGLQDEELWRRKAEINLDGKQVRMKSFCEALPIAGICEELLTTLKTKQVVVVSGRTGSGKSTPAGAPAGAPRRGSS